jgi:uncharacterized membrane protein (UPF0127 family)
MRIHSIPLILALTVWMPWPLDASPPASRPSTQPATETITIAGEMFKLELAADFASRNKGLMGRTSIDDRGGMLFIHTDPAVLSFWMANCVIDIDILFLDSQGRITATHQMKAEPPKHQNESQKAYEDRLKRYSSKRIAQFAIELKAGSIERLKLKPGQVIEAEWERLRKLARD